MDFFAEILTIGILVLVYIRSWRKWGGAFSNVQRVALGRGERRVRGVMAEHGWDFLVCMRSTSLCVFFFSFVIFLVAFVVYPDFCLDCVCWCMCYLVLYFSMSQLVFRMARTVGNADAEGCLDDLYCFLRQVLPKEAARNVLHSVCSALERKKAMSCLPVFVEGRTGSKAERGEEVARLYMRMLSDLDIRIIPKQDKECHDLLLLAIQSADQCCVTAN